MKQARYTRRDRRSNVVRLPELGGTPFTAKPGQLVRAHGPERGSTPGQSPGDTARFDWIGNILHGVDEMHAENLHPTGRR